MVVATVVNGVIVEWVAVAIPRIVVPKNIVKVRLTMPIKAIRTIAWVAIPVGIITLKLADWFPDYKFWFFILMMVCLLPTIVYCAYKSDDWTLEEAEEIKRRRDAK
jgi:hypothetical protein